MQIPETIDRTTSEEPPSIKVLPDTRIDPAHRATEQQADEIAEARGIAEAVAPGDGRWQQFQVQAAQLASRLQARQKELDYRESQINSRAAQVESDVRTARLWLAERDAELTRREQELEELARALAEREAAAKAEQEFVSRAEETARHAELAQKAESLQKRQQEIEEAEARLAADSAEVHQLREQLVERQRICDEEARWQRERTASEQQRALDEIEEKRRSVHRRSEHVDQCRAALEQTRAELGRMHRETLEIRLATEELWVQLSGAAPPAALTRSLGRIRSKLADEYRLASAELARQKAELETIRRELLDQHQNLAEKKRQFEQWMASREEQSQEQAVQLVAREQQLRNREREEEARREARFAGRLKGPRRTCSVRVDKGLLSPSGSA